jgi:hypothetical protein
LAFGFLFWFFCFLFLLFVLFSGFFLVLMKRSALFIKTQKPKNYKNQKTKNRIHKHKEKRFSLATRELKLRTKAAQA